MTVKRDILNMVEKRRLEKSWRGVYIFSIVTFKIRCGSEMGVRPKLKSKAMNNI